MFMNLQTIKSYISSQWTTEGRYSRLQFGKYIFLNILILLVFVFLASVVIGLFSFVLGPEVSASINIASYVLMVPVILFVLIVNNIQVVVKRLHDL